MKILEQIIFILCSGIVRLHQMLKSLRNRILVFFILVALVIAGIVFPLNYLHKQQQIHIQNSVASFNDIYLKFVQDLRYNAEFMALETTNPNFFITGESPYLRAHDRIQDSIDLLIDGQLQKGSLNALVSDSTLHSIENAYDRYCTQFDSIVLLAYKRGYRFLGMEGEMLSYMNTLSTNYADLKGLAELRVFEREFLNRSDTTSVVRIRELTDKLIIQAQKSPRYSFSEKNEIEYLLKGYRQSFEKLLKLDSMLGLKTNTGMRAELTASGDKLENALLSAISLARETEGKQLARLNGLFAILSIVLLVSIIGLSIYLSRYLVNHLEKLTRYISQLARHNFDYADEQLNLRKSSSEIREIYREFRNMVAQLRIRESQRDRAINEVRESEKHYRELAELLPQSIFETDRLGNLVYVNRAWFKAFGFNPKDLEEGLNLIEILQTNTDNNLFGMNRVENSDYIAIRKDNSRFPAQVYSDTITKGDKISGRRGIIIDATLRNKYIESLQRETARAVSSDKLKSSFLANMSHEIRTPMNSIIGFANLLSAQEVPETQKKEFVQHIQSSGKMLLSLIDDIIDIAKIEAGEIKIKPGSCEPVQLIKELAKSFEGYKSTLGKEGIKLKTIFPREPINFQADSFRLKQILSNLTSNAIKFTEKGSVTISCRIKNERSLEFAVEDTGIGLTKEELNIIFSRFKRAHRTEEKNIAGTGLGLTISKNLVELMGGQMWVSSVPGEGSRFSFELPFKRISKQGKSSDIQSKERESRIYNWDGRTILVAEDDETSYVFIKEILQKTNARIVHAVNGKEVVEAVKFTEDIDIVLMDIHMPFIDGYNATRMIKKMRPSLPIIAQTAYAMDGDREKSIMAGCDDYLTKPINPPSLLAKISQFMPLTLPKTTPPDSDSPDYQGKEEAEKKKQD